MVQESVISYNTWPDNAKPKVKGIATCLQDSTSAGENAIDQPPL